MMENNNIVGDESNHGSAQNKEQRDFYKDAAQYWAQVPATLDGVLGGFGFISSADIQGSTIFLRQLFRLKTPPGKARALDCGAGIGRVTKNLLFHHFQKVDLVEQNPAFVAQAQNMLGTHQNMGNIYCAGLQEFCPEPARYDVIWCQWVLGHLTDDDLIVFLQGCIDGLKENGMIVLKENVTSSGILEEDPTDSSVTRPLHHLCQLLQNSGLECIKQKRQDNLPRGLYPIYMIATRPARDKVHSKSPSNSSSDCVTRLPSPSPINGHEPSHQKGLGASVSEDVAGSSEIHSEEKVPLSKTNGANSLADRQNQDEDVSLTCKVKCSNESISSL